MKIDILNAVIDMISIVLIILTMHERKRPLTERDKTFLAAYYLVATMALLSVCFVERLRIFHLIFMGGGILWSTVGHLIIMDILPLRQERAEGFYFFGIIYLCIDLLSMVVIIVTLQCGPLLS